MTVDIRRGTARFVEREPGRATHHAFSFGAHYDPERLAFGPMVCHDDHVLGAGRGFDLHHHEGLDIVTYVVEGVLEHRDASGEVTPVPAGSIACLRAADGVEHAETAAPGGMSRFVQVWLRSSYDGEPSYAVTDTGGLDLGAARLTVVRLDEGESAELPTGPLTHIFVATGALVRSSLADPLSTGDAFLATDESVFPVTAGVPTVLLVWTFPADAQPSTESAPGSTSTTA